MKIVKSLMLGSAAGLLAMSGAQAADLPVKAKAVEYVRICSLYGAGFFYIPGTDTCIKLGGYLRAEVAANTNSVYTGNTSDAVANGTVGVYYAFIQFAGFTMGKAVSQFSAPWANLPGNTFDGLPGGGGAITGVNQFSYTADFGNGVSGTLSAQDQTVYYQAGV